MTTFSLPGYKDGKPSAAAKTAMVIYSYICSCKNESIWKRLLFSACPFQERTLLTGKMRQEDHETDS